MSVILRTVRLFVIARPGLAGVLALGALQPAWAQANALARLEQRGQATQLIVDGQPYLIRGGELANTASSDAEYMAEVWPRLAAINLNTVLTGMSWAWVEPEEGRYDFSIADRCLAEARQNKLHIIFLWFASWKNGVTSFAPDWVKADQQRFPRARIASGKSLEVLSTLSEANRDADARAFAALMRHLSQTDREGTVIMIQLENEVGLIGDSRDRTPAANAAFAGPVPRELMDYLQAHRETLFPTLRQVWEAAGGHAAGTWSEVFGNSEKANEIFMAWNYARYMNQVAAAGKAEHPIPIFTNTWIVQPEDEHPGDYPSGGPEPMTIDIWKAGAPKIDFNAPDIYLPNFKDWTGWFHRPNNPLFVPEARGDQLGAAQAFYAVGRHNGMGYSPMGIDDTGRLRGFRGAVTSSNSMPLADLPMPRAYGVLRQLTPAILEAQAKGTITAVILDSANQKEGVALGNYIVQFNLLRNRRNPAEVPAFGYGLAIALGPDEYLVSGENLEVSFAPNTPGPAIVGLGTLQAGRFENGRWVTTRLLSGDDILLRYDLDKAAEINQSGSGLKFGTFGARRDVQRVRLYRYE